MQEHVYVYYETIDGIVFGDKDKAYRHETNYLYINSGFTFYKNGEPITDLANYDTCDCVTLEPNPNNEDFIKACRYYYGWSLPDDILTLPYTKYTYDWESSKWTGSLK